VAQAWTVPGYSKEECVAISLALATPTGTGRSFFFCAWRGEAEPKPPNKMMAAISFIKFIFKQKNLMYYLRSLDSTG
jgi:hypothetical protein